ncbi:hypothetical protein Tcan_17766 [Toxocara canis]|uniref:Uncharacterized protein n=1 Tax=Toxocara canis TaxID=6265 RepID=A0A0B2VHC0_TOXCA|nr:hypothetical protein Tcan_17766 [Toxocara canis]
MLTIELVAREKPPDRECRSRKQKEIYSPSPDQGKWRRCLETTRSCTQAFPESLSTATNCTNSENASPEKMSQVDGLGKRTRIVEVSNQSVSHLEDEFNNRIFSAFARSSSSAPKRHASSTMGESSSSCQLYETDSALPSAPKRKLAKNVNEQKQVQFSCGGRCDRKGEVAVEEERSGDENSIIAQSETGESSDQLDYMCKLLNEACSRVSRRQLLRIYSLFDE